MPHKLNYKIVGKREEVIPDSDGVVVKDAEVDVYDVEWTHDDGPFKDTVEVPTLTYFEKRYVDQAGNEQVDLIPQRGFETRYSGSRAVVADTIRVKRGSPLIIVSKMLDAKRARLAENLGVTA